MNCKKEITALFRILLVSAMLSVALTSGGVNAQEHRYLFEIIAENSRSSITTVMQVYAENEKAARDHVILNGWRVLSVKQLTYRETVPADINIPEISAADHAVQNSPEPSDDSLPQSKSMTADEFIESLLGPKTHNNDQYEVPRISLNAPESELVDSILGGSEYNAHVVIPASDKPDPRYNEQKGQPEYPADLPDPENLSLKATVYFDLGIIQPNLSPDDIETLNKINKTSTIYLYGHTDNVSVGPNASYADNFELSILRAEAIKSILNENGINSANIISVGMGALYPVVENSSGAAGTAENRRVEIYEVRTSD